MEKSRIFGEPMESMLTAKVHVFSEVGPGALDASSASVIWKNKAEAVKKSNSWKNGIDGAGQSIEIEWHVCFGAT